MNDTKTYLATAHVCATTAMHQTDRGRQTGNMAFYYRLVAEPAYMGLPLPILSCYRPLFAWTLPETQFAELVIWFEERE